MKKIKIVIITLIVVLAVLYMYKPYDYKISNLKTEKIEFDKLPLEVKEYFYNHTKYPKVEGNTLTLINLDRSGTFSLKSVKTWYGPWIAYEKLIDNQKNISYRIETSTPDPYVIYQNKLYVPNVYNILTVIMIPKNIQSITFTCYALDR